MTAQLLGNPGSLFTPISTSFLPFGSSTVPLPVSLPKAVAKFYAAMDNYGNFMAIAIGRKAKGTQSRPRKC